MDSSVILVFILVKFFLNIHDSVEDSLVTMLVMDKVVALIALAVAKKASAYAVVRVSEVHFCS